MAVQCFESVNSSVGLCFFAGATYRSNLISVGDHKKNTDLQNNSGPFSFVSSHSAFPTKMTYENLFILVFLWSHSGWPYSMLNSLEKFSCLSSSRANAGFHDCLFSSEQLALNSVEPIFIIHTLYYCTTAAVQNY